MRLPLQFLAIGDVHGNASALRRALELARHLKLSPVCFGDVLGGPQPKDCIALLQAHHCLTLRGNHEQWALERKGVGHPEYSWLHQLPMLLENDKALALHTRFLEEPGKTTQWFQLQGAQEVRDFLLHHRSKRYIFAAHSHLASLNLLKGEHLSYVSNSSLRDQSQTSWPLNADKQLVDVGIAEENLVAVDLASEPPQVRFHWF